MRNTLRPLLSVLLAAACLLAHAAPAFARAATGGVSNGNSNGAQAEAPVGGRIPDRGAQVINPRAFGARCDGATDDYAAISAAVAAADALGVVPIYAPGACVTGQEIVLSRPHPLLGNGRGSGFYRTAAFNGTSVVRFRPTAFPFNEGFRMDGFTISSVNTIQNPSNAGEWACASCSTVHALWLDGTAAPASANIENLSVNNSFFLPVGGHAVYAPASNPNGVPAKSAFVNDLFYGGFYAAGIGDSVTFVGGKSVGLNRAFDVTQVRNATQLMFVGHNATNPAGSTFRGALERFQILGGIWEVYKNYGGTAPVCVDGGIINIIGTSGGHASGAVIRGAHVSALSGMACHDITLAYSDSAHISDNTLTTTDASKYGIVINSTNSGTVIGENVTRIADATKYISDATTSTRYDSFLYASTPSTDAAAAGLAGNLSVTGVGQFGAGARFNITPGASGLGNFFANESGTDAGFLRMPSASHSDATRRRDWELGTLTNGSGISFWTRAGGATSRTGKFLPGGDLELFTAGQGVILHSPDGTRYRLTVSNAGALVVTAAP